MQFFVYIAIMQIKIDQQDCMLMPKIARQIFTLAGLFFLALTPVTWSAELVMLERDGCVWCMRWDEEVGPIYPKTAESKTAPLRRVDIDEPWPDDLVNIAKDQFTPTFILVDDGKEIGRMRGYAGDEFFWVLLDEMLGKLAL
tara:strand:+ start:37027 stop:37452 length:426 start_codon:yes stop_codon:yes gene_type:complete